MKDQSDIYYEAMLARDYRFDGKFFAGVKTTGIYCRPICPARPKRENVEFFKNALSAEKAGYRPCLRCRPESAPLSPAWNGKSALVQRALRMIAGNRLSETNEDAFAEKLGVSARHLRRLFEDEIGRTPKQIADNHRLDFARKLIIETKVSITDIAFASGFSSIRRFNDAVQKRFTRSPRELRGSTQSPASQERIQLSLSYRPPFDWASLLRFYKTHAVSGIEWVDENSYERVFKIDKTLGAFRVTHLPEKSRLLLETTLNQTQNLWRIAQTVRHMFDLDSDPILIANAFSQCSTLGKLVIKYPGIRLPRGWDPYETAVCAILGQLVSTEQASRLAEQLVQGYGEKVKNPFTNQTSYLFPTPKVLANADLNRVGTTSARKASIQALSKLVIEKKIKLESVQDPAEFRETLLSIKGIGPWTTEYVALRAIGDTDAFPATDLILRQVLERNPHINLDNLKPWRAYGAMYLWKQYAPQLTKKKVKHESLLQADK